jgi:hypothetical protein
MLRNEMEVVLSINTTAAKMLANFRECKTVIKRRQEEQAVKTQTIIETAVRKWQANRKHINKAPSGRGQATKRKSKPRGPERAPAGFKPSTWLQSVRSVLNSGLGLKPAGRAQGLLVLVCVWSACPLPDCAFNNVLCLAAWPLNVN